eukprot:PhF_6_TR32862/c0_g1_i2/m.48362
MFRRCRFVRQVMPSNFEWNRQHHLTNSLPTGSPYKTKCGRTFDPNLYFEMMNAICDQKWIGAIHRHLRDDSEYQHMVRTTGNGATAFDALCQQNVMGDDQAYTEMKNLMENDQRASLSVCALLDAYQKIKDNRDEYKTMLAAGQVSQAQSQMNDAMSSQHPFGSRMLN